jgi:hypothetical protein
MSPLSVFHRLLVCLSTIFVISCQSSAITEPTPTKPTYYIGVTGDDTTGTGTTSAPWKTLAKACKSVTQAGDVIHVKAGVFVETAQCTLEPGVSVEGEGLSSVLQSTITQDFTPLIYAGSAVEGTNGKQSISRLKLDGKNLTGNSAIWVAGRSNVSIHDIEVVDFFDNGVIFSGKEGGQPTPPSIYATGNMFYNNKISNSARYNGFGRGGLMIGGQKDMLIHDNTIIQDSRPSGENGWLIKYFSDGYLKNVKIYNNTLIKNQLFGTGEDWSFAIELFRNQGVEIFNNKVQGSLDFNFQGDKGAYPYTLHIHDNQISVPAATERIQEGMIFEFDTDSVIIENNTFDKLTQGVVFYARDGNKISNITIQKNLVTNLGNLAGQGYFVGGFGAGASYSVSDMNIFNNTVISAADPAARGDFAMGFTVNSGSHSYSFDRLLVKNNILAGFRYNAMLIQDRSKFTNSAFQNNDFYNNGDDTQMIPSWASANILFPSSTVASNNLATINPLFVGAGNYALQANSALVDAGVNVGLPFNGSAPDIGYAER